MQGFLKDSINFVKMGGDCDLNRTIGSSVLEVKCMRVRISHFQTWWMETAVRKIISSWSTE